MLFAKTTALCSQIFCVAHDLSHWRGLINWHLTHVLNLTTQAPHRSLTPSLFPSYTSAIQSPINGHLLGTGCWMEKNRTQTCVSIQPRCHRNLNADHRSYRMPLIGVVAWRSTVPDKNEILQHSASHPPRGSRFPLAIGSMPRYPFPTVSSFCSSSARLFAVPRSRINSVKHPYSLAVNTEADNLGCPSMITSDKAALLKTPQRVPSPGTQTWWPGETYQLLRTEWLQRSLCFTWSPGCGSLSLFLFFSLSLSGTDCRDCKELAGTVFQMS